MTVISPKAITSVTVAGRMDVSSWKRETKAIKLRSLSHD